MQKKLLNFYLQQVLLIILVHKEFITIIFNFPSFIYAGLDVHDCESISSSQQFQIGNVITIEPGRLFNIDGFECIFLFI